MTYEIGDFFTGILLETCKDAKISRPRVRPIEYFPENMRVQFPRDLREKHPIGTRFRANVHVAQKHNKDGSKRGGTYLVASKETIQLESQHSPIQQIFAIPVSDRTFKYIDLTTIKKNDSFQTLREKAYSVANSNDSKQVTSQVRHSRSSIIRSYAIERSKGICEGCDEPAPFITRNGKPYLEVHHLVPISKNGADNPINVSAICPNCHRRTEKSRDGEEYNESLKKKISKKETSLDKKTG